MPPTIETRIRRTNLLLIICAGLALCSMMWFMTLDPSALEEPTAAILISAGLWLAAMIFFIVLSERHDKLIRQMQGLRRYGR